MSVWDWLGTDLQAFTLIKRTSMNFMIGYYRGFRCM